ncbi:FAD-dependent monooxygenase [Phenylobacterium sp.]|uniref:FAD-dependent monooxygenase n=1 Tax=Phenylobacterium sp. TaxID=1871053 RepID=UPI0025D717F3|nr:FAD-dependent monooxygenase [Phenylobacterium sp.]
MAGSSKPRVAIVGAGIGGLTAGLLLANQGYPVHVHEQARRLGEVGAGLTLSKGAQATLREAGVLDAVRGAASLSATIPFLHYRTGERLAGEYDRSDGTQDTPEIVGRQILRADLHAILAEAYGRTTGDLSLSRQLVGIEPRGDGVRLAFSDGTRAEADLLIGADGLRSTVREVMFDPTPPLFTGQVAWRFLAPWEAAAPFMGAGRAAVYFGPGRVINRYTLRRGRIVNCVALARSESWFEEGWSVRGDPAELRGLFEGWHRDVTGLLAQAPAETLRRWGLFHREPLAVWRDGGVTLLGDAAHPMLPFLGLGAAMAIEDAMVLARALALEAEPTAALDLYEAVRKPRTAEVFRQSVRQGELLQSRDPDNYDPAASPASDRTFFDYDPVTAPLRAA